MGDSKENVEKVANEIGKKANFFMQLVSDTGNVSSTRFMMLVVVGVILIKYVAFNVVAMIGGTPPVAFDIADAPIIGAAIGGKVLQSFSEKKS